MNKYMKFGIPLSIGVVAMSIPLGYVAYSSSHPKQAVNSKVMGFWEKYDKEFVKSFKMSNVSEAQDSIRLSASIYINSNSSNSDIFNDKTIQGYISEFKDLISFTPDFTEVFSKNEIDPNSFKINVFPYYETDKDYSFKASVYESDELSTFFGLGFENSVYELFNDTIPAYLATIATDKDLIGNTKAQYDRLISEGTPFGNNLKMYQKFLNAIYGKNGVYAESSRYNVLEMYCLSVGKIEKVTSPIMNSQAYIPNPDADISFEPYLIVPSASGVVDNTTIKADEGNWGTAIKPWKLLTELLNISFDKQFERNFTSVINSAILGQKDMIAKRVKIMNIPLFMGMTQGSEVSFEYAISSLTKEGLALMPSTVSQEQRTNTFYYKDKAPMYGYDDVVRTVTNGKDIDREIFKFFNGMPSIFK